MSGASEAARDDFTTYAGDPTTQLRAVRADQRGIHDGVGGLLSKVAHAHVPDDTDDSQPCAGGGIGAKPQSFADRILVRPEAFRGQAGHEGARRAEGVIRALEQATRDEGNAHGGEVVTPGRGEGHEWRIASGRLCRFRRKTLHPRSFVER